MGHVLIFCIFIQIICMQHAAGFLYSNLGIFLHFLISLTGPADRRSCVSDICPIH